MILENEIKMLKLNHLFYDKGKIEYGEKPMFKDNVGDAMMNVLDYDIGDENGNRRRMYS